MRARETSPHAATLARACWSLRPRAPCVALASPAHAETWTASADSPRDPALPAAQDLSHVESTFDDETGTWSVELSTYAEADDASRAAINTTLFGTPTAGFACGAHPDDAFAIMRANTLLSDTTAIGSVTTTSPPHRPDVVSRDGSALVLTDATLVGRRPVCANANLSRNRVLDGVLLTFSSPSSPATAAAAASPRRSRPMTRSWRGSRTPRRA